MTDDRPWEAAAQFTRSDEHRITCGPRGTDRDTLAAEFRRESDRMTDQLPAVLQPGVLTSPSDTYIVPALIADAGNAASWRYIEFFSANIRNPHTRRAYAPRVRTLLRLVRGPRTKNANGYPITRCGRLGNGQVMPTNPAAAVRGPTYVVTTGKTPVLDGSEWRRLLDAIPTETVRYLRDRALIGTLTYSFARVGAALKLKVEELRPNGIDWRIHLHEKGGKENMMPCHYALSEMLYAYVAAVDIAEGRKGWLFRTSPGTRRRC
jgi:integrase